MPKEDKYTDHKAFREAIISRCFDIGRSARIRKRKSPIYPPEKPLNEIPLAAHKLIYRGKRGDYAVCKRGVKQRALEEVSANKRAPGYRKMSMYSCRECDTALCKEGTCFNDFHSS